MNVSWKIMCILWIVLQLLTPVFLKHKHRVCKDGAERCNIAKALLGTDVPEKRYFKGLVAVPLSDIKKDASKVHFIENAKSSKAQRIPHPEVEDSDEEKENDVAVAREKKKNACEPPLTSEDRQGKLCAELLSDPRLKTVKLAASANAISSGPREHKLASQPPVLPVKIEAKAEEPPASIEAKPEAVAEPQVPAMVPPSEAKPEISAALPPSEAKPDELMIAPQYSGLSPIAGVNTPFIPLPALDPAAGVDKPMLAVDSLGAPYLHMNNGRLEPGLADDMQGGADWLEGQTDEGETTFKPPPPRLGAPALSAFTIKHKFGNGVYKTQHLAGNRCIGAHISCVQPSSLSKIIQQSSITNVINMPARSSLSPSFIAQHDNDIMRSALRDSDQSDKQQIEAGLASKRTHQAIYAKGTPSKGHERSHQNLATSHSKQIFNTDSPNEESEASGVGSGAAEDEGNALVSNGKAHNNKVSSDKSLAIVNCTAGSKKCKLVGRVELAQPEPIEHRLQPMKVEAKPETSEEPPPAVPITAPVVTEAKPDGGMQPQMPAALSMPGPVLTEAKPDDALQPPIAAALSPNPNNALAPPATDPAGGDKPMLLTNSAGAPYLHLSGTVEEGQADDMQGGIDWLEGQDEAGETAFKPPAPRLMGEAPSTFTVKQKYGNKVFKTNHMATGTNCKTSKCLKLITPHFPILAIGSKDEGALFKHEIDMIQQVMDVSNESDMKKFSNPTPQVQDTPHLNAKEKSKVEPMEADDATETDAAKNKIVKITTHGHKRANRPHPGKRAPLHTSHGKRPEGN